jgi:hypothetical protein
MNDAKYYRQALAIMLDLFSERRTDVAEYCEMVLDEATLKDLNNFKPEARFIEAGADNIFLIQYDTLTTLLHISVDGGASWKQLNNHQYK